MEATVLLADWAEAINGKLYIQGAGWSRISPSRLPGATMAVVNCALAIKFDVGWEETNQKHEVTVRLVDDDGNAVVATPGNPVRVKAQLEVGRPPGVTPGAALDAALALQFRGIPLAPGRYRFCLDVDDQLDSGGVSFSVF